jgi:tol-pal system protein YbgF
MNQNKPHTLSRFLLVTLMASASVAAHAQNSPAWLGWGQSKDAPTAAPAQPATATETPSPAVAVSQPLGAGYAGTGSEGSGQAVIIQNLLESVSRLQEQMSDLRGQVEEQGNEINRLKKAQQSGFSAFDDRISKLEQGGAVTGGATQPPAAPAAPVAPSVSPSAPAVAPAAPSAPPAASASENEKQQALYNAAFAQLKDGHYEQAITGFQAAIDAVPQGQWTPSALFWQGETYYVLQKRAQADAAYQKILTDFPKSDRVPDALLKTGYIAYDENKNSQARSIFQKVMSQYPDSQAANLAKQRLARMTAEKR